ncbi:hypothetical protein [Mucilaginibacter sp.]
MKKILLIALLLLPILGFSQTDKTTKPIDGFLGIKFGSTKAAVIAAIKARGGKVNTNGDADNIAFDNVSLGHRETEIFFVRFVDNKAFEADFTFTPADNNHAIEYYNSLVSDLNDIYGKGESTKKFTAPYVEGDGHEQGALVLGAAEFNTYWEASNDNAINASIEKEDLTLTVKLVYQDAALFSQAIDKQKSKDKSDY